MKLKSKWITTREFQHLRPIHVFHKETGGESTAASPIQNYHVHFRKKLLFHGGEAVLRISADDYYKLYVNGQFVCQGPAPAYAEYYRYNQVDISSFLKEGENAIAVHVYYQGLINRVWNSGDNRMGLIADLYVDGKYVCGTDESWLYHRAEEYSGTPTGYDTQFLEDIDFRKKEARWKEVGFGEEHYLQAVALPEDDHVFEEKPAVCVSVYHIRPERIVRIGAGEYFLDFGSEIVGQFSMKVRGNPGQKVRILCGEELEGEDSLTVRYQMRCNCTYQEECILSGEEDELEYFDYKAYRYVHVISEEDNLDTDTFCAVVRHHPFREQCRLSSGIPWVEDIWKLCVNSLKWGVQEGYLDCPSREKGQYLGDFTVSGLAHMYVTGDTEMYRKTLLDFAKTTKVCRGLMAVAPGSFMQEIADFSLQYPLQILHYYRYTKDVDTLRELYPVVRGLLEYFEQYEREDGLLCGVDDKWNLVDWPRNLRDGYDMGAEDHSIDTPCHNVLNAHYIGAVSCAGEIAEILGIKADHRAEGLKKAFLAAFYDEESGTFYDTEAHEHSALHANVLPVFYGIAPAASWGKIKDRILDKGLVCGTQFSYFVLKALGKMGAYREELQLIINESEHSWVNMLREGATTCFEAWGKEQKANTSLCHPWSCAPIIALMEDIRDEGIKILSSAHIR